MPKDSEPKRSGQSQAMVRETLLLVDPNKSRRLREWARVRAEPVAEPAIAADRAVSADLPENVLQELEKARRMIDEEIERIRTLLPEGRKKSLFKLRFGAVEEIRSKEISAVFKLFKLDSKRINLKHLGRLNYHGERVS